MSQIKFQKNLCESYLTFKVRHDTVSYNIKGRKL